MPKIKIKARDHLQRRIIGSIDKLQARFFPYPGGLHPKFIHLHQALEIFRQDVVKVLEEIPENTELSIEKERNSEKTYPWEE